MRLGIFREKHGSRYFSLEAPEGSEQETQRLQEVAMKVFVERFSEDWYDCSEMTATQRRYFDAASGHDAKAALAFLNSRKDYEYEGFEVVETETV